MKIVVVMPMYNERPNVEPVVKAVLANGPEWNVLVVDDNSPDGTGQVADQLAASDPRVTVLHRPGKLGLGTAYRDGFVKALQTDCDYICTMDSDFSHNPTALPFLRALAEKHGAAHGSRYVPGGSVQDWRLPRKINSTLANSLSRAILGTNVRDCTAGFRCYRRDIMERLEPATLTARGYAILEELLYRCARIGIKPAEHPITFVDRKAGRSKINIGESFRALGILFKLRLSGWKPQPANGVSSHDLSQRGRGVYGAGH